MNARALAYALLVEMTIFLLALVGACGTSGVSSEEASTAPQASATLPLPAELSSSITMSPPVPTLRVIPYTDPLTITGLPYPAHCTMRWEHGLPLPDPACTPGSVGDKVTQDTIDTTICVSGWTDTIQPDSSVTGPAKIAAMQAYGIPPDRIRVTEGDHFVPRGLGGADDVSNYWPQPSDLPGSGFVNSKDQVERVLQAAVCHRQITLDQARQAIVTDWITARERLGV